jgi:hypothetical protein
MDYSTLSPSKLKRIYLAIFEIFNNTEVFKADIVIG